jgi:MoCo/4Fe-4S cofactor protein with predicted Tat translocation signal
MKNQSKNTEVWVGVEHLEQDPIFMETLQREFSDSPALAHDDVLNVGASRRDFLKYLGFSVGAATLAASCDIPVKKAIPYVVKPDEIVPGVASYYASSYVNGGDYCAVLVKTREGRPIKVEGNVMSSVTQGGTNARVQASVLSLYDTNRYQSAMKSDGGKWSKISWEDLDKEVGGKLASGNIRVITNTILSPTSKKALGEFLAKYPGATVVTYDAVSSSAMLQANEVCYGQKAIPNYMFDKASMIVSFGADFLGTWISPVEYARQYAAGRRIERLKDAKMSRHIQVESGMTLTGSNADHRILVRPSEMGAAIAALHNAVAAKTGGTSVPAPKVNDKAAAALAKVADQLAANPGKCIVVSGTNNIGEQTLVNAINNMLDSWGSTMTFANASLQRQGVDAEIQGLVKEMAAGSVGSVIVWGANPAFDLPNSAAFAEAFSKVKTKISFNGTPDETTALCDYVAPTQPLARKLGRRRT